MVCMSVLRREARLDEKNGVQLLNPRKIQTAYFGDPSPPIELPSFLERASFSTLVCFE